MSFIDLDVLLDASELTELRFDADAFGVRPFHDALGDRNVFIERLVARVDHDRTVEPGVDAIVAGFLVAMVKMDGENSFGKHLFGGPDHRFQHPLVGILPGAL